MAKVNWKLVGILTTIAGAGLSLVSGMAEDKKMEATIEDKVEEALARREENEDEEESY